MKSTHVLGVAALVGATVAAGQMYAMADADGLRGHTGQDPAPGTTVRQAGDDATPEAPPIGPDVTTLSVANFYGSNDIAYKGAAVIDDVDIRGFAMAAMILSAAAGPIPLAVAVEHAAGNLLVAAEVDAAGRKTEPARVAGPTVAEGIVGVSVAMAACHIKDPLFDLLKGDLAF